MCEGHDRTLSEEDLLIFPKVSAVQFSSLVMDRENTILNAAKISSDQAVVVVMNMIYLTSDMTASDQLMTVDVKSSPNVELNFNDFSLRCTCKKCLR